MPDTSIVETIKAVGAIITPIALAYIAYKQIKLSNQQHKVENKVDAYSKEVDGMKTELVEAVKGRGEAEGELKAHAATKADLQIQVVPVTEKDAEKIATTVVDTVKKDPDIEIKKTE